MESSPSQLEPTRSCEDQPHYSSSIISKPATKTAALYPTLCDTQQPRRIISIVALPPLSITCQLYVIRMPAKEKARREQVCLSLLQHNDRPIVLTLPEDIVAELPWFPWIARLLMPKVYVAGKEVGNAEGRKELRGGGGGGNARIPRIFRTLILVVVFSLAICADSTMNFPSTGIHLHTLSLITCGHVCGIQPR